MPCAIRCAEKTNNHRVKGKGKGKGKGKWTGGRGGSDLCFCFCFCEEVRALGGHSMGWMHGGECRGVAYLQGAPYASFCLRAHLNLDGGVVIAASATG